MNFILLIDAAALIGIFFHDPFLFQNWNLSQMSFVDDYMKQRVKRRKQDDYDKLSMIG